MSMWLILLCTLWCIGLCFLTTVMFCGRSDGDTIVDTVFREVVLMHSVRRLVGLVFGERGEKRWDRVWDYVFASNNCLIQVMYTGLIIGGFAITILGVFPLLPNRYFAPYHKLIVYVLFASCLFIFVLASTTDPGVVTAENVDEMVALYPTDRYLYPSVKTCTTCDLPKPPRSKHCVLCDVCVSRFDHHCVWIGNCVGRLNYRWFFLYLVVHSVLLTYGSIVILSSLYAWTLQRRLWQAQFRMDGKLRRADWWIITQYVINEQPGPAALGAFCCMFSLILIGFTLCHFFTAFVQNSSTNERFRLGVVKMEVAEDGGDKRQVVHPHRRGFWDNFGEICFPDMWKEAQQLHEEEEEDLGKEIKQEGSTRKRRRKPQH